MSRLSSTHRIVLGLVSLTVSVVLMAGLCGLIPNPDVQTRQARRSFCESTAVSFMALAPRMDAQQLHDTLDVIRERNSDVLSVGVRDGGGKLVIQSGPHSELWKSNSTVSQHDEIIVPITASSEAWGQLEFHWAEAPGLVLLGTRIRPDIALSLFAGMSLFVAFSVFLRKVLRQINPGKVVPNRVRDALNSLAEGLLVLDRNRSIVLANEAFATSTGTAADTLVGRRPDRFDFSMIGESETAEFPWDITARCAKPVKGVLLTRGEGDSKRTYSVGTVPVKDENQENRGVVVSFEDVTQMQLKQEELRTALSSLKTSTEEIRKQNHELEFLATRDTLTGCLNRRSFFHDFEKHWQKIQTQNLPISAVMVDIDHFKAINDNHGHGVGDDVLREVATTVMKTVENSDLVCRYGGEEFTILMPGKSLDEAELKAEQCRLAIKALDFGNLNLKVTASLGVSAFCCQPESPQDLLDQADKCLFVAKRNGRDKVVRFDRAQSLIARMASEVAPTREEERQHKVASAIPFQAVAALTSALAHRDQATALHSRRVADMCVATGEGLLSLRECYVLEIAALLHDIGKIGIPDALLRKSTSLTPGELELVHTYNRMGVEMVRSSFGAAVLTEIMEQHVVHYDMSNSIRGAGPDRRPSIGARILAIANAYDTMVSEFSYRSQMSRSEAFAELRRCSGSQFDPELVERFIAAVRLRVHEHVTCDSQATKESALSIGLLLEQLVASLDDQDVNRLLDITDTLQITATTHGLHDIARQSKQLHEILGEPHDEIEVMQMAGELLDMCRSTQSTLLDAAREVPIGT